MATNSRIIAGLILAGAFATPICVAQNAIHSDPQDYVWLANDKVRVGLKKSSGGAIFWVSPADSNKSLINSYDRGRLIQQSWYGKPDGSLWNTKPWRWNPVQGGDWQGKSATILEQKNEATTSWLRTQPIHWATGDVLKDCVMEQAISLDAELIHVRYRFIYSGTEAHPAQHQELPAFFVEPEFATLVLYEGGQPWTGGELARSSPAFPNEYKKTTEHWAAYVNDMDQGIGCFVPVADELTCYRFSAEKRSPASCSYFAPIRTLAITPGFKWDYEVWITMGSVAEIRKRFQTIALTTTTSKPGTQ